MPSISPHEWAEISPYLDQALLMDETGRAAWLDDLGAPSLQTADHLVLLLQEHRQLALDGFLDSPPPLPTGLIPHPGQTLEPYVIVRLAGEGGTGSVWVARRNDGRFERMA